MPRLPVKETFTVTVRPRTRLRRIASVGRIRTTKVRPPFSVTVRVPTVAAPRLTRTRTRQLAAPFAQLTVMPNRPFASTRTDRFASRIVGAFPGVAGFAGGVAGGVALFAEAAALGVQALEVGVELMLGVFRPVQRVEQAPRLVGGLHEKHAAAQDGHQQQQIEFRHDTAAA